MPSRTTGSYSKEIPLNALNLTSQAQAVLGLRKPHIDLISTSPHLLKAHRRIIGLPQIDAVEEHRQYRALPDRRPLRLRAQNGQGQKKDRGQYEFSWESNRNPLHTYTSPSPIENEALTSYENCKLPSESGGRIMRPID